MFLPTTIKEVRERGWDQLDVILFSGDAYRPPGVRRGPSWGVCSKPKGIAWQSFHNPTGATTCATSPNWAFRGSSSEFRAGRWTRWSTTIRPTCGCATRCLHPPAAKRDSAPDHAVTVYSQILKRLYPHVPVVVGGIEASLRRLTHYDYWSDALKPSVLADSGADLLIYGMGERVVQEVARRCATATTPNCCAKSGRWPSSPTKLCLAAGPRDDDPSQQLRGVRARQGRFRREFHRHRDPEQSDESRGDARGSRRRPLRRRHPRQRDALDRGTGPLVRPPPTNGPRIRATRARATSRRGR